MVCICQREDCREKRSDREYRGFRRLASGLGFGRWFRFSTFGMRGFTLSVDLSLAEFRPLQLLLQDIKLCGEGGVRENLREREEWFSEREGGRERGRESEGERASER
jgi:hypothetical protein